MNCTGDQEIGDVCPIFYSGSIVSTVKLLHTNFQVIILKIVGSPGFEKLCCIITKNLAAYQGLVEFSSIVKIQNGVFHNSLSGFFYRKLKWNVFGLVCFFLC